jgi:hypothetical protein
LLVEEQRQNLLLNSATLSTQTVTVTAVAHTLSFYGTGTVTLTGTSTAGPLVGTGANARVSLTFTPTAGSLTLTVSGSVTNANLELGSFGTSWIPTTGTAATRTADVVSCSGANFSSWYRQDEGCVFVDGSSQNTLAAAGGFLLINDPAGGNRVDIRQYRVQPIVQGSGGTALVWGGPAMPSIVANAFYRQAMAYSATADNHADAVSGVVETSTTSLDNIVASRLALFMRDAQTAPTGGTGGIIRRITYWPRRFDNSTLSSITQ